MGPSGQLGIQRCCTPSSCSPKTYRGLSLFIENSTQHHPMKTQSTGVTVSSHSKGSSSPAHPLHRWRDQGLDKCLDLLKVPRKDRNPDSPSIASEQSLKKTVFLNPFPSVHMRVPLPAMLRPAVTKPGKRCFWLDACHPPPPRRADAFDALWKYKPRSSSLFKCPDALDPPSLSSKCTGTRVSWLAFRNCVHQGLCTCHLSPGSRFKWATQPR